MEVSNDDQFEQYLKQFRPISPQRTLPEPIRSRRDGMIWLTAAATACFLVALAIWTGEYSGVRTPQTDAREAQYRSTSAPLTVSKANALLARSRSVKAALNEVAFQRPAATIPSGSRSALEILGKEKTKL